MDQYAYLLLGAFVMVPWLVIYYRHERLRRKLLKASILGALVGPFVEYFYTTDYWLPPTLTGALPWPEDVLFGFAGTGVAATLYDAVFRVTNVPHTEGRKGLFYLLFVVAVMLQSWFTFGFAINSMVVNVLLFFVMAGIMLVIRPDLLRAAWLSAVLMLCVIAPIYMVLFNVLYPSYWDEYWLLSGTPLGVTVLGSVPLLELLWYLGLGFASGVGFEFANGNAKQLTSAQALPG